MAETDIIRMRPRELKRLNILHKVIDEKISQVKAGELLSLSDRQVRRIIKKIAREGDEGILHQLRGRKSGRAIPKKIKQRAIATYRKKYSDFGPLLASEKLEELEGIKISRETLRGWLVATGDWKGQRRGREHRKWRERKEHPGEMVQIDGSHHDWFEGRGPECVLMGYIDDATSKVYARFYGYEGTLPAMDSFQRYCRKYGIPQSVYFDRHSTYKSQAEASIEDELSGRVPESQFERALRELSVRAIHAYSPQAKGRIERLFRTFQDRVTKEMRLKKISSQEEGNIFLEGYLPVYNRRYSIEARSGEDVHRPALRKEQMEEILSIHCERTVRNDFTIIHEKRRYQLYDSRPDAKVQLEERVDGTMRITCGGKKLRYKEVERLVKNENKKQVSGAKARRKLLIPSKDHPWRRYSSKTESLQEPLQEEALLAAS